MTIDDRIEQLDLGLFSHVMTTTPEEDLRTLLALQAVVRRTFPSYTYLEIGSYQGGSLQQLVIDSRCAKIVSIDPRPGLTPDTRGAQPYKSVSAAEMLEELRKIPGSDVSKVRTFESTASDLTPTSIGIRPEWCFVDGEHTDEAVMVDGRFCLSVLAENGVIAFHDANLVFKGLQDFLAEVVKTKRPWRAHLLPNFVFLVEIGSERFCEMEPLRGLLRDNYKAYFAGMMANDWYRIAYNMPVYRVLRKIRGLFPKRQP